MLSRLKPFLRRLGRAEKLFLALLVLYAVLALAVPDTAVAALTGIAATITGLIAGVRAVRGLVKRAIWRLRNRLIFTYIFIAVVPVTLILVLAGISGWILTGQMAAYLVVNEIERRVNALLGPGFGLVTTPPAQRAERMRWMAPYFAQQFPGLEMLVRDGVESRYPGNSTLEPPPSGWADARGLILRDGLLHLWAHVRRDNTEAVVIAPLTRDGLLDLAPGLGEVYYLRSTLISVGSPPPKSKNRSQAVPLESIPRERVPPPVNRFDILVDWAAPVDVAVWESPGQSRRGALIVRTRPSAVLRTVFGQKVEWAPGYSMGSLASMALIIVGSLFLAMELISLVIGVSLTRTITEAVHRLYEGTQRVMQGDFSHRIEVQGSDQLAQLGHSFNHMTENLERLVAVEKEKERMQAELEIAREVQSQLFPKATPALRSFQLRAACRPALMVSGDYYDYLTVGDSRIALAIGDVAGKGISAALLMATVQSMMRTQLGAPALAAAVGAGSSANGFSTAHLVSRLNHQLFLYTSPEKYATFYFAIYDERTGLLTYTNAGHLPPILLRSGAAMRLDVNGMVVGAFSFASYQETSIPLQPGDVLVCFTDGVTEPENEYGEMFGEERLVEVLLRNAGREPDAIIASITEAVLQWTGSPQLQDDMTMLVARKV